MGNRQAHSICGLRVAQGHTPLLPLAQFFLFLCTFWKKLGKVIGWHPFPVEVFVPVWEILEPPLDGACSGHSMVDRRLRSGFVQLLL